MGALTETSGNAAPSVGHTAPAHVVMPLCTDERHPHIVYSNNALGTLVARCGGTGFEFSGWTAEQCEQFAAFIVKACNAHDDLVALLSRAHTALLAAVTDDTTTNELLKVAHEIRVALSKADGAAPTKS